jgi:hypothetical protein
VLEDNVQCKGHNSYKLPQRLVQYVLIICVSNYPPASSQLPRVFGPLWSGPKNPWLAKMIPYGFRRSIKKNLTPCDIKEIGREFDPHVIFTSACFIFLSCTLFP